MIKLVVRRESLYPQDFTDGCPNCGSRNLYAAHCPLTDQKLATCLKCPWRQRSVVRDVTSDTKYVEILN